MNLAQKQVDLLTQVAILQAATLQLLLATSNAPQEVKDSVMRQLELHNEAMESLLRDA